MQEDRNFWSEWARLLQHWKLDEVTAALLEATGPVNVFLAQFIYAGEPLLNLVLPADRVAALASLIEDPEESRSFAAFLREESSG